MHRVLRGAGFAGAALLSLVSFEAQAAPITLLGAMSGANEVPVNASPAIGSAKVTLDLATNTLQVDITWSGLTGGTPSAAHIHCCTVPGTNVGVSVGFPAFPATTSGTYSHLFDLTSAGIYTTTFLNTFGGGTAAGAETALANGLVAGQAYANIHNATFPGGEIRGLLAVPEPGTLSLFGLGLLGLGFARRKLSAKPTA